MEPSRLSRYAKELIAILNRNPWIREPCYCSGISCGLAKTVVSPAAGYSERLSDKCWLKIISTPSEKMQRHWGKETSSFYIDAIHESFSSSFSQQAKKQPERFAKPSLHFPGECYHGYIYSVISALQEKDEKGSPVDMALTCEVVRRFRNLTNASIAIDCLANWRKTWLKFLKHLRWSPIPKFIPNKNKWGGFLFWISTIQEEKVSAHSFI